MIFVVRGSFCWVFLRAFGFDTYSTNVDNAFVLALSSWNASIMSYGSEEPSSLGPVCVRVRVGAHVSFWGGVKRGKQPRGRLCKRRSHLTPTCKSER